MMYDKFLNFSGIRYFVDDFFSRKKQRRVSSKLFRNIMYILNLFVSLLTICAIILKNASMLSEVPRDTGAYAGQTVPGLKS